MYQRRTEAAAEEHEAMDDEIASVDLKVSKENSPGNR